MSIRDEKQEAKDGGVCRGVGKKHAVSVHHGGGGQVAGGCEQDHRKLEERRYEHLDADRRQNRDGQVHRDLGRTPQRPLAVSGGHQGDRGLAGVEAQTQRVQQADQQHPGDRRQLSGGGSAVLPPVLRGGVLLGPRGGLLSLLAHLEGPDHRVHQTLHQKASLLRGRRGQRRGHDLVRRLWHRHRGQRRQAGRISRGLLHQ